MPTNKELEEQLRIARKDIEALAHMAGVRAAEEAEEVAALTSDQLDALSDEARAMYEAARKQGADLRFGAEDWIRENPMLATGLAVAGGFVLARLLRN